MTRPVVALLTNDRAGGGRGRPAAAAARRELDRLGVDVLEVTGASAADSLLRARASAPDVDALVVVGGDGGVHLGAQVCAGTDLPLGLVPAGSGDDVARALGLPRREPATAVAHLVAALRQGPARAVDLLQLTGAGAPAWAVGVLSAGVDALVTQRANALRWPRGTARYVVAVAQELPALRARTYDLVVDGASGRREALLVTVANGPSFGGGMRIAPAAELDDGLLDLVVVDPLPRTELLRVFPSVFTGGHVRHPAVHVRRVRSVEIRTTASGVPLVAHADGEPVGPLPLRVEVAPGALRLLA